MAYPIDIVRATEFSGGSRGNFYRMLENFDDTTIKSTMKDLVTNYNTPNYKNMVESVQLLWEASRSMGASRVYYVCHIMRAYY